MFDSTNKQTPATKTSRAMTIQRVDSLLKPEVRKLDWDDFIWGKHADHYSTSSKDNAYITKGEKVMERTDKNTHTTFDAWSNVNNIVTSLQKMNINKPHVWMDKHPGKDTDFTIPVSMNYVEHSRLPNGDLHQETGTGSPVIRVQPDPKGVGEITGNREYKGSVFYSPFHLQDVE